MQIPLIGVVCLAFTLIAGVACTSNNPDQIRQRTAQATEAVKRDSKAVALGLKDGLTNKKSVDLNRATREDLENLPGMDSHKADRIIAERPYANTHQLVTRHILSDEEYQQVHDRVVVNR